jgi:hypothetical protein
VPNPKKLSIQYIGTDCSNIVKLSQAGGTKEHFDLKKWNHSLLIHRKMRVFLDNQHPLKKERSYQLHHAKISVHGISFVLVYQPAYGAIWEKVL